MSVTAADGNCVVVDPFPAGFGYDPPKVQARVCLVTHEHHDHNAVENVLGQPEVIRGPGKHTAAGMEFVGVAAYHDDQQGAQRGPNTLFSWSMGGVRLAHLGDLGHTLNPDQVQQLGPVDVLMLPAGGHYTLEPPQAVAVARQLEPKIVLPMHYKTPALDRLPIGTVAEFLSVAPEEWEVEELDSSSLDVGPEELAEKMPRIVVLDYR